MRHPGEVKQLAVVAKRKCAQDVTEFALARRTHRLNAMVSVALRAARMNEREDWVGMVGEGGGTLCRSTCFLGVTGCYPTVGQQVGGDGFRATTTCFP